MWFLRKQLVNEMQSKYREAYRSKRHSWEVENEPEYYKEQMREELYEFFDQVQEEKGGSFYKALRELADVCNYGLMYLARKEIEERDKE